MKLLCLFLVLMLVNPLETQYSSVKFINTTEKLCQVKVNGENYTIKPKETLIIDYIIDEFTYQVIDITEQRTRKIKPKETFTIKVTPN